MKKLLLLMSIVSLSISANAQEPDYNVAPDFTVTDLDGNTHNLYTYLDQGKTVVLDLFATWCGPCWNYAGHPTSSTHPNFGALEDFYAQYGPNGTNEVVVISIEVDGSTGMADLQGTTSGTAGDWITGTLYPLVDDASIAPLFNLSYYPTIVMICPDRYAYEIGQESVAGLYAGVGNCPSVPTASNDPRVLGQNSDEVFCAGNTANMNVVVQNYGTSNVSSLTIDVLDGTTSVLTKTWTGNLAMYEATSIDVGDVSPSGPTSYTIKITDTNDDTSNDATTADVSPAAVLKVNPDNKDITVDVIFDNWASEFGIIFEEGMPTKDVVPTYQDAASGATSPIFFSEIGTFSDGDSDASFTFTANTDGCHHILFVDNYGDGLTDPSNGSITISGNATGNSMSVDPDYGQGLFVLIDIQSALSVVELSDIDSKLYPNPVKNQNAILELNTVNGDITVTITDITGKQISVQNVSTIGRVELPTQNLEAGVYIVSVITDNGVATQKIIVE